MTLQLSTAEIATLIAALRTAADVYRKDATEPAYANHAPQLIEQFARQVVAAESLEEMLSAYPRVVVTDYD